MSRSRILVVAGAFQRADGLWLMHRRPQGKHHAGLWEFPGGKVEPDEIPKKSLTRELHEELGVVCHPGKCEPVAFAESEPEDAIPAIVILLYKVSGWEGIPAALEGGEIGWFTPQDIALLAKPPLDVKLASLLFQNY